MPAPLVCSAGSLSSGLVVELAPVLGRGQGGDAAEAAVELRERLEAHVIGDFRYPGLRFEKESFGHFHTSAVHIVGEGESSGALKYLAEVEGADAGFIRHFFQAQRLSQIVQDVFARTSHRIRVAVHGLQEELFGNITKLGGKEFQHRLQGLCARVGHDLAAVKEIARRSQFRRCAAIIQHLPDGIVERHIRLSQWLSAKMCDGSLIEFHWYANFAEEWEGGQFAVVVFLFRHQAESAAGGEFKGLLIASDDVHGLKACCKLAKFLRWQDGVHSGRMLFSLTLPKPPYLKIRSPYGACCT